MDASVCLTNNDWLRYAEGRLGQDELSVLMVHVSTCPVCSDIRDGIDAMANRAQLAGRISCLNQRADEALSKPTRLIGWYRYGIAASLFFAAALAGWWLSQHTEAPVKEGSTSNPDTLQQVYTHSDTPGRAQVQKEMAISGPDESVQRKPTWSETREPDTGPGVVESGSTEDLSDKSIKQLNVPVIPDLSAGTDDVNSKRESEGEGVTMVPEQADEEKQVELKDVQITKTESLSKPRLKTGKRVAVKSKSAPAAEPMSTRRPDKFTADAKKAQDSSRYETASRYYEQEKYRECLQILSNTPPDPSTETGSAWEFLKAKTYIKLNRKPEAAAILNRLIERKSYYAKEAEALYKTL